MSAPPRPGTALTLWHASGIHRSLDADTRRLLARARPEVVMLHGAPGHFVEASAGASKLPAVLRALRDLHPAARVWIGVGCDGAARRLLANAWGDKDLLARFVKVARVAREMAAEALVLDPASAWKAPLEHPNTPRLRALIPRLYQALRGEAPGLSIGHTAYDHPMLHKRYPWRQWCGEHGADFAMPRVYAAPEEGMGGPHALDERFAAHQRSWDAAVTAGMIRPGLPVFPYLQAHGVPAAQTIRHAARLPLCALWSAPARIDAEGARALEAVCALRRLGMSVEDFQRSKGLAVNDVCGPTTLAALGIAV